MTVGVMYGSYIALPWDRLAPQTPGSILLLAAIWTAMGTAGAASYIVTARRQRSTANTAAAIVATLAPVVYTVLIVWTLREFRTVQTFLATGDLEGDLSAASALVYAFVILPFATLPGAVSMTAMSLLRRHGEQAHQPDAVRAS